VARSLWTPRRDAKLLRLRAEGRTAAQVAISLRTTRSAVIGRMHRLLGTSFASNVERAAKWREESRTRKESRRKTEQRALDHMRKNLDRGMLRDDAMARARKAGTRFSTLARFFGLTTQAVHIAVKRFLAAKGKSV
jgi:hypothetical protein